MTNGLLTRITNVIHFRKYPPALLNSMDIKRYIDNGCLIDPDEFDKDALQPASYQMKFLGEAHYWDYDNGILKRKRQNLREGKKFEIKKKFHHICPPQGTIQIAGVYYCSI